MRNEQRLKIKGGHGFTLTPFTSRNSDRRSFFSRGSIIPVLLLTLIFATNAHATHDPEDPDNIGCPNDSIYPTDPIVVTYNQLSGLRLPTGNQIGTGIQAEITTFVKDACGHLHPAVVIIEVRDSNDVTIYLGMQTIDHMQPYSVTEIGMSWNAPEEPGNYQIRAFTLVNLNTTGFGSIATSIIEAVLPEG